MAPEIFSGEPEIFSGEPEIPKGEPYNGPNYQGPIVDVFAAGVVLFRMVTGLFPFK